MGERLNRTQEADGSIPFISTIAEGRSSKGRVTID